MSEQDPYAILGVPPNATDKEIRKAYISRCKVLHPDRFDPKTQPKEWAQANEMHAELNRAYATLRNASPRPEASDRASATPGPAASPNSTSSTPPAPHRSKRSFIARRVILGLIVLGICGLYVGVSSLWRQSGIHSAAPVTLATQARNEEEKTTPSPEKLRQDAERGDADAQFYLGKMYELGYAYETAGVPKDAVEAIKWYRKAAEQGHQSAQVNLGLLYTGAGVPKDAVEAVKWFRKAAEQGNAFAQSALGSSYQTGDGVPKDAAEAVKWYRKAAEQGDVGTQNILGYMYQNGDGVGKDAVEAARWYRKAAERGNPAAQISLGSMYETGEDVPKDTAEAIKWYRKAAEWGDLETQVKLGFIYEKGEGVAKDAVEAAKWFRKGAEQGDAPAQTHLGFVYASGQGVAKDAVQAIKWYRKAAETEHAPAQAYLGAMYLSGLGVAEDAAEAAKWFRKAAEQENAFAQRMLGYMYSSGNGVPKDTREGGRWYLKAAEQGDADAQRAIGAMYASGNGVTKNAAEAGKWFSKAAEQGDAGAKYSLGLMYLSGENGTKDAVEAARWLRKAALQGYGKAQWLLGSLLEEGSGVPKDEIEALAWYYIAAASGNELVNRTGNEARTFLERRLGPQVSLLAQRQSKEILKMIQSAKANGARLPQSEVPGDADREETSTQGQSGTGVFVTTDGLILTAAHVVKGISSIQIQTSHGVKQGRLLGVDTKNDLALIKCEGKFQPAPVKAARDVKLGQAVFTIGFPNVELQGVSPKMTRGEISSLAGLQDDPRQWQVSVPVQPGNSGGPLFDEAGNVIGVIVAKLNAIKAAKFTGDLSQNVNYAVKSAPALQLLAPYREKLAHERQVNPSDKVENVVEQCRESVVLIFGYGP